MASRQYLGDSKNPFFGLEDDVDDATFLRHPTSGSSGYMLPNNYQTDEDRTFEEKRQQLLEQKRKIEERTLQSTQRSLGLLRESEQMGVETAEELMHQREQLERTERRLDEINSTLHTSQKHIQGIKSIFGGLKNYFSGRTATPPKLEPVASPSVAKSPYLGDAVEQSKRDLDKIPVGEHPGLKVRGLDDDDDDLYRNKSPYASQSFSANIDHQLDENLEEMSTNLSRLKGLASGLGDEIVSQNDLLDRVGTKTDRADITIDRQNRDMRRILKKN